MSFDVQNGVTGAITSPEPPAAPAAEPIKEKE